MNKRGMGQRCIIREGEHEGIGAPQIATVNGSKQDMERLVACWNFCQGVPNDQLHPGRLGLLIDQATNQKAELAALREALRVVIECNDNFLGYVDKGKVQVRWTDLDGIAKPWTPANSDRLREALKQARAALSKGGQKP